MRLTKAGSACCCLLVVVVSAPIASLGDEPVVDRPLLAHWTFDEDGPSADIRDTSGNEGLGVKADRAISRTRGVHGKALDLSGKHRMPVTIGPHVKGLSKITFSAWTRPTDLSSYREIFRQECPERLLFSYQNNGSILSLGLNVGGYVECDGRINPAQVLDGWWHHCAATFDGQMMRVYLDGKEIASLQRPGQLVTRIDVPAFIGSSSGRGEHFQGSLDDLRIYKDALTPKQIAALYHSGLKSIASTSKELEKRVNEFYVAGKTFADTLVNSRKNLQQKGGSLDRDLAGVVHAKLKSSFPDDYERFVGMTGTSPLDYLMGGNTDFQTKETGRLVEMMLEYKPLTEHQWAKQPPEERKRWKEAEQIAQEYERLKALGDAARFSPEWIDVMLEAGRRVQHRPRVSEAVAPYMTPETPETGTLTAAEAREALQRDWLHQASGKPTPERIKNEIQWARELAARISVGCVKHTAVAGGALHAPYFSRELAALADLEKQLAAVTAPDQELYFKVREIKRAVMFKNPVVDFDRVLFVDMPFPHGKEWPHETRHRLGYMAVPGGRLLILDGLSPAGKLTQLMPQPPLHGSFWRPDVSYDARKVLFCFKPHNEKSFHLYEINVDGTGLVQLTDGRFDDMDPIYLPDEEHIIFSTTRGQSHSDDHA